MYMGSVLKCGKCASLIFLHLELVLKAGTDWMWPVSVHIGVLECITIVVSVVWKKFRIVSVYRKCS